MRSRTVAHTASPCASSAGCAFCVSVSSSAGPSKQSVESGMPNARSMLAKSSRAAGWASTRSLAIPGFCDPWPGKSRTMSMVRVLEADDHRGPGEAGAERDHQDLRPLAYAARLDHLVERDRDRRRRGVAVAVHAHVDLFHRDAGVLRRRLDDPDVGLVRDEQVDVGAEIGRA